MTTLTPAREELINPAAQEAYRLIGQLNESNIKLVVGFIKKLLGKRNGFAGGQAETREKMAAFEELLALREKLAAADLPPVEDIRREAIEEKYGCNL